MANIVETIEALRRRVAEDPRRGVILEEPRPPPAHARTRGWLPEAVFQRWASPAPGVKIHANHQTHLPAAYVALFAHYGSLHWLAPPGYDGELAHAVGNAGPDAFLSLAWPEYFSIADFRSAMDTALVTRLEAGFDGFHVFHGDFNEGAAFDTRVRDERGEPLVIEPVSDHGWIDQVLHPRPAAATRTFEQWLDRRIAAVMAELDVLSG